jgi:hypothetical protein
MRKVSTTKLAKQIGMESLELFRVLCENRWMYKKEDKWYLTKEGRMVGGEIAYNPKFGEYIVWPVNLDINAKAEYEDTIKATELGEYFSISAQKVNLQLSELGWIRKDIGGWISTKAGEKNGAIQMEAMNGKPYVVWDKSILNNKHLIREIKSSKGENDSETDEEYNEKAVIAEYEDFRLKFPANLRAPDGHYVRSRAEILIDDFLYKNGIVHAYERKLNVDEVVYCDFYIPSQNVYIEYWGLEDEKYLARKKAKLEIYAKYGFNLIELDDSDIENLDEKFAAKLRKYKINVN